MPMWIWILLGASFGFPVALKVVLQGIVLPCLVWRRQTFAIRANFTPGDPSRMTAEVRTAVWSSRAQFAAEGFDVSACLETAGDVSNVSGMQFLMVHPGSSDNAVVFAAWGSKLRSVGMAVRSEFTDGSGVTTGVSREVSPFPRNPLIDGATFVWVKDAATLCELHRRRLDRIGDSAKARVPRVAGQEIAHAQDEWDREMQRHVREGYLWRDDAIGRYRYTWRGAFLAVWKVTQPVKGWWIKLRDRRARREWAALGMDTWTPPVSPGARAEPPPLPVRSADETSLTTGELRYEAALGEGEIHRELAAGALTVRMGRETHGQFLARSWGAIVGVVFWTAMLCVWLTLMWQFDCARMGRPAGFAGKTPMILGIVFLAMDLYKLINGLATLRGTSVITASERGLAFAGAPAWRGAGHLPREEIDGLRVVLHRAGFRRQLQRLEAFQHAGRTQRLLVGADKAALEDVRRDLAVVMGIEAPPTPPQGIVEAEVLDA